MIAVVEQTRKYVHRMEYDREKKTFHETESYSLAAARGFQYPYGWIKESGTPPEPHWDVIIMTENEVELGEELPIRIIGVFQMASGDHKFIAVEIHQAINDLSQLSQKEMDQLNKLYPRVSENEGWFGSEYAMNLYETGEKAL